MNFELPKLRKITNRPKKKKILLLSDDLRLNSGIGVMSRELVVGTAKYFDWVQLGAAIKNPDAGKIIDVSEDVNKEMGIDDASVLIYPNNGYGDPQKLREIISRESPDAILHFTDPRFWEWLYDMEREIRTSIPLMYYNIWDDLPYPHWNAEFYASCDFIFNISKQTHNLVNIVLEENEYKSHDLDSGMPENFSNDTTYTAYIPHGINNKHIYKISDKSEVFEEYTKYISEFKRETPTDFLVFWNNRNIRRKQPGDVILAFSKFCELLRDNDRASRCVLVMHTDPIDGNGTDLIATVKAINPIGKVIFSDKKIDTKTLNFWYNFADVVVNIASNEGFGLSGAEAIMAGTPIINNVTGGLQDQCGFVDSKGNHMKFTKDFPTNHSGVLRNHGEWAYPVFPSNRSLQGSPATPYIFDDRVSFEDVAVALLHWYNIPRMERKALGSKGIDFALNPEIGMSAEEMSNRFIKNIGIALENWKPRSRFSLHKIKPEKTNKAIGIL